MQHGQRPKSSAFASRSRLQMSMKLCDNCADANVDIMGSQSISNAVSFSYQVPVFPDLGGTFCVSALDLTGRSRTRLCGLPMGAPPTNFAIKTAPSFLSPRHLDKVDATTEFSWTPFTAAIHRLRFLPVPELGPLLSTYTLQAPQPLGLIFQLSASSSLLEGF